jgi:hypothetical protein
MPVSAGARRWHAEKAAASGEGMFVDLSRVPQDKRPAVVAEIKEVVKRATTPPTPATANPLPTTPVPSA